MNANMEPADQSARCNFARPLCASKDPLLACSMHTPACPCNSTPAGAPPHSARLHMHHTHSQHSPYGCLGSTALLYGHTHVATEYPKHEPCLDRHRRLDAMSDFGFVACDSIYSRVKYMYAKVRGLKRYTCARICKQYQWTRAWLRRHQRACLLSAVVLLAVKGRRQLMSCVLFVIAFVGSYERSRD